MKKIDHLQLFIKDLMNDKSYKQLEEEQTEVTLAKKAPQKRGSP